MLRDLSIEREGCCGTTYQTVFGIALTTRNGALPRNKCTRMLVRQKLLVSWMQGHKCWYNKYYKDCEYPLSK